MMPPLAYQGVSGNAIQDFESWDDLTTRLISIIVQIPYTEPDGTPRRRRLKIYTPTYHEWHMIGAQVPDPDIPRTIWSEAQNAKLPNPYDKKYLEELARVREERDFRRLIFCLEKAGIVVPGDTMEAKLETLKTTLDAGIANALLDFLRKTVQGGIAKLEAIADSF